MSPAEARSAQGAAPGARGGGRASTAPPTQRYVTAAPRPLQYLTTAQSHPEPRRGGRPDLTSRAPAAAARTSRSPRQGARRGAPRSLLLPARQSGRGHRHGAGAPWHELIGITVPGMAPRSCVEPRIRAVALSQLSPLQVTSASLRADRRFPPGLSKREGETRTQQDSLCQAA